MYNVSNSVIVTRLIERSYRHLKITHVTGSTGDLAPSVVIKRYFESRRLNFVPSSVSLIGSVGNVASCVVEFGNFFTHVPCVRNILSGSRYSTGWTISGSNPGRG